MSQSLRRVLAVGALVSIAAVTAFASITRISGPTSVISWPVLLFDAAFDTTNQVHFVVWGPHSPGPARGQFLNAAGGTIGGPFAISDGTGWTGWARVAYSEEYQTFLIAYTKILGVGQHQRTVRFATYNAGSVNLGAEIPVANFSGAPGEDTGDVEYSPGADTFLMTWREWEPGLNPESYVVSVSPAGVVGTRTLVSNPADGQSDPKLACNDSGRCLIVGFAWGGFAGGVTSIWGRFVDGAAATPVGTSSFYVDTAVGLSDKIAVAAKPNGDFLTASIRGSVVWGKTVAASGTLGPATLLKQSVDPGVDGGGYGFPSLVTNPTSQTILLTMGNWFGSVCAQELTAEGVPQGFLDCVPFPALDNTGFNVGVADPVNSRFLLIDNHNFATIRASVYSATPGGGGGPTAPTITTHPQSVTIPSGTGTTLTVAATGSAPLSYQWYAGTAPNTATPVGSNQSSYTTPSLTGTQSYWVRVSNTEGSADSNTAVVSATGESAPVITSHPQSITIPFATSTTLTVAAAGTGLAYQWYAGTAPNTATPVGTNSSSYTTPLLAGSQNYWVRVSNSVGAVNSNTATVNANGAPPPTAPTITTHPQSITIPFATSTTLNVVATGSGLSYQWYAGTSPNTATPVGTNSSSYTTPLLAGSQNYWVRVSNSAGVANSNTATVNANGAPPPTAPTITTHPQSVTIPFATSTTLSVVATGSGLSYQWYAGTAPNTATPVGTSSSSYTTPLLAGSQNYWVRVSNSAGMVNSNTATVNATGVVPNAPEITTHPQSKTITFATSTTLTVVATGTGPLSYQWYAGTAPNPATPVGTNSSSYTTPLLAGSQNYWVRVSNSAGSVNSNTATINATAAPPTGGLTRTSGPSTVVTSPIAHFDTAFDTISQVYLVVWGGASSGPVQGQFLNATGALIGAPFEISTGGQWSRWARVVYSEEQARFLVAYTKSLGPSSHQRTARMLTYSGGSPAFSSAEIVVDQFTNTGDLGDAAYSPGADTFVVSWREWEPGLNPQSYVAAVSPAGVVGTKHLVTNPADGQSDPTIACNDTGRCLVAGFAWGTLAGNQTSVWGRFVDGSDATPVGASSAYIDSHQHESEVDVAFNPETGNFLVAFTRDGSSVWGKVVTAGGGLGTAFQLKASAGAGVDGGGFGLPSLSFNHSSRTMMLAMSNYFGQACAQELGAGGAPIGSVDCVSGTTRYTRSVADPVNTRFLMLDNFNFSAIRATLYAATPAGGGGE